ncbi:UDP-glucose 4-epimerase [Actinopolyspora mzabensis]|uniref:UDP-glucose 4-epimerase n=1 Tax=Actinopolyspora mzabensis TaxID=995066 RepID=A0A1G8WVB6_ACTMZ|nr:NAD-dependent epimerase/dehydratase family protein [Actinopolyspora mzabensis]SDJ82007.1 UDP-glucose 4-epimerase [Actinopolyspora mzabensis]
MVPNVVLVTGVSRFVGAHLAGRLAENPAVGRVLGVDSERPRRELSRRMGRAEFVRADIRNPLIARIISEAAVDTVVHASSNTDEMPVARAAMKEMNVLGTMRLLAACQESPHVRKLVVKSTSAVYGASSRDPAVFDEEMAPKDLPSSGYAKDAVEVEGYVRGFGRRRPDVAVTLLRFTDLIGPRIDSVLTRYFSLPLVPTVFGHDARLQLLHPEDALAVLRRAALEELPGVFNVGADGVLMLGQAIRRAGRVPVPIPGTMVSPLAGFFRGTNLASLSAEQMRFLNFGRVVDTAKLRDRFGFAPRWTTQQAFDDFVHGRELRPVIDPEMVEGAEREINRTITRLR